MAPKFNQKAKESMKEVLMEDRAEVLKQESTQKAKKKLNPQFKRNINANKMIVGKYFKIPLL